MEISAIKSALSMETLLAHYGLRADRNRMLQCPFHPDKTPSMQVYPSGTVYCFSSHCVAHGKSIDVIDFIFYKEKCSKHEAIEKAKALIMPGAPPDKLPFLEKLFGGFVNAVPHSQPARDYLALRGLDGKLLALAGAPVGYNGGQFHHGRRKEEQLIAQSIRYGLLSESGQLSSTGEKAYKVFGKNSLVFALKNQEGATTSLYFRSIVSEPNSLSGKHFYLKDRSGLYPRYPKSDTKRIIITESIIDAASLLMEAPICKDYEVLAAYGTNGLSLEHTAAIKRLTQLEELIFFFDGDDAGRAAVKKYSQTLQETLPNITLSQIEPPEGEDINSLLTSHSPAVLSHVLHARKVLGASPDPSPELPPSTPLPPLSFSSETQQEIPKEIAPPAVGLLHTTDPGQLRYETPNLRFTIWGGIETENQSRLKVSLHVQQQSDRYKSFRDEVNLYSHSGREKLLKSLSDALSLSTPELSQVLEGLTAALENYREHTRAQQMRALVPAPYEMTAEEKKEALAFLTTPGLVQKTLDTLSHTGLVGETRNGLLLYFLYLSRFFEEPLHAIILGRSGSGKTYLQTKISECLPEESVRTTTSLSENTLYYSPKNFWKHIVLLIEDLDGVYGALLPLREFMSKQSISKLTTDKDAKGNNVQKVLTVEGPVCVSGATTKEHIYEDNANRSFLLYVDESAAHLDEVMSYQRRAAAGRIDKSAQESAKQLLRNTQRLIDPGIRVVNPYAESLRIPGHVFKKLRTNTHYLKLIEIITFYHQHQRPVEKGKDQERFIRTTLEDIYWANMLVKEVLLKKSDELSGALRDFFELLKSELSPRITPSTPNPSFFAKDIRKAYRLHPMQLTRHLIQLEKRGYIRQVSSHRKSGYEYEVVEWQEYKELQEGLHILDAILAKLQSQVTP